MKDVGALAEKRNTGEEHRKHRKHTEDTEKIQEIFLCFLGCFLFAPL